MRNWLRILVTDVTEMHGGMFCVAGWDEHGQRMVRPLSGPARHWNASLIRPTAFWPGMVATFEDRGASAISHPPHAREDRLIHADSLRFEAPERPIPTAQRVRRTVAPTLRRLFEGVLLFEQGHAWRFRARVPAGATCASLGAVVVPSGGLRLREDSKRRLRAVLRDRDGTYDLPVVSHAIRETWRREGLGPAHARHATGARHVRIGLARPRDAPGLEDCYVMVNGTFPL